jgi:hypothetical protein
MNTNAYNNHEHKHNHEHKFSEQQRLKSATGLQGQFKINSGTKGSYSWFRFGRYDHPENWKVQ